MQVRNSVAGDAGRSGGSALACGRRVGARLARCLAHAVVLLEPHAAPPIERKAIAVEQLARRRRLYAGERLEPRLVSEKLSVGEQRDGAIGQGVRNRHAVASVQRETRLGHDRAFGEGPGARGVEVPAVETRAIGLRRLGRRLAVRPIRASRLD